MSLLLGAFRLIQVPPAARKEYSVPTCNVRYETGVLLESIARSNIVAIFFNFRAMHRSFVAHAHGKGGGRLVRFCSFSSSEVSPS